MPSPRVYIILLNWHGADDTIACLHSLSALDYRNYRAIVVDNGSTDDSVFRIEAACPGQKIVATGKNLGFSGGCNVGIEEALNHGAQYVWLLNNDTKVDPLALRAMVSVAESDKSIGAVGSVLYHMGEPKKVQLYGGGIVNHWFGRARHRLNDIGELHYISGASILLRASALRQVGLLDAHLFFMYWEDTDLSFRMERGGWKLAVAHSARVLHKESASLGRKHPLLIRYFNESAVRFFRRHTRFWFIPVLIGMGGRAIKCVLRGEFKNSVIVVVASWEGLFPRQRGGDSRNS